MTVAVDKVKMTYTHEALADMMLTNPSMTQKELALAFDRSPQWIWYVTASDAFQAYLSERRKTCIDPIITHTVQERLNGLASRSVDVLMTKLEIGCDAATALKSLEVATKALGYGARDAAGVQVQNNFVVAMPGKVADAAEWAAGYKGGSLEAGGSQG